MESLALGVAIILFIALVGGPVSLLLTYVPDTPRYIKILRRIAVSGLSIIGLVISANLAFNFELLTFPRLIGALGLITSVAALLYEFRILKRKNPRFLKEKNTCEGVCPCCEPKKEDELGSGNGDKE